MISIMHVSQSFLAVIETVRLAVCNTGRIERVSLPE